MSKTILAEVDGWTPVIDSVVQEVGAVPALVFGRVWRYCQMSDGVCEATQQRIADDLGMDRVTVNRHIALLVEKGYLEDTTPEVKNRPHVYRDTGKAGLKATITATNGVENCNTTTPVGVAKNNSTVAKSNTTDAKNNSGCGNLQQRGVANCNSNQTLLRDSLRDNERENSPRNSQSPPAQLLEFWQMILGQLRVQLNRADFETWVAPLSVLGEEDGVLRVGGANQYGLDWVRSRLKSTIDGLASGVMGKKISTEFVLKVQT